MHFTLNQCHIKSWKLDLKINTNFIIEYVKYSQNCENLIEESEE